MLRLIGNGAHAHHLPASWRTLALPRAARVLPPDFASVPGPIVGAGQAITRPDGPDVGERSPSRLVATAAENHLERLAGSLSYGATYGRARQPPTAAGAHIAV
jgi:hypothetical protein